jgi:hypothetical protein
MIEFKHGGGSVVAADARSAITSVDEALLSGARMCASFLEASQGSNLPASQSQRVIRSIATGMNSVVEARAAMVSAIKELRIIQGRSNLAAEAYGCPDEVVGTPIATPKGALDAAQPV